jgi:hypothetical protein
LLHLEWTTSNARKMKFSSQGRSSIIILIVKTSSPSFGRLQLENHKKDNSTVHLKLQWITLVLTKSKGDVVLSRETHYTKTTLNALHTFMYNKTIIHPIAILARLGTVKGFCKCSSEQRLGRDCYNFHMMNKWNILEMSHEFSWAWSCICNGDILQHLNAITRFAYRGWLTKQLTMARIATRDISLSKLY